MDTGCLGRAGAGALGAHRAWGWDQRPGPPQLSAESGWDGTHGGQDTSSNLGELGGAGMVDPLLCLSHCCGKGPRQVAGESGLVGSLFPNFIEVCVRLYVGDRDRHRQLL